MKPGEPATEGNTISVRSGDEFLGYGTAIYSIDGRRGGGVRVKPVEAVTRRGDAVSRATRSIAPRFRLPGRMRNVRLLFMQMASDADHAMAVLAADGPERLRSLTQRVQDSPVAGCHGGRRDHCEWIPAGVAVVAEKPGSAGWAPVR